LTQRRFFSEYFRESGKVRCADALRRGRRVCLHGLGLLMLVWVMGCQGSPEVSNRSVYFENEGKSGSEARKNADRALQAAFAKAAGIRDVTADLMRQERVGDRLQEPETIHWIQRVKPHSLHLTWTGVRLNGREVVYVAGANDDKVLVRLPGWLGRRAGTQKLSPTSSAVTSGSRYSITVVGYDALVKRIVENYDAAARRNTLAVVDYGIQKDLNGCETHGFKVVLDHPGQQHGDYHTMIFWIDVTCGLPIRFVGIDKDGALLEDYLWLNLKINQGLTDEDFVIGNPAETPEPEKPKPSETVPAKPVEEPSKKPAETAPANPVTP